jgi:2-polyprenyl-3-methyl-5-hydroxy-6-metoxy-1,4-benzoquinol methylase
MRTSVCGEFVMERVNCAICNKNSTRELLVAKDEDKNTITIVECNECKLAYINPRYEPSEIRDFYDDDYHIFNDAIQVRQISYALEAIKDINRFKSKGNLLDIGSAKGIFPLVAQKNGFDVTGLEISKFASDFSKKAFGIPTISGTVEEADLPKNYYDIITMFDVIEHFRKPKNSMAIIRTALKEDGILVVDTPNINSIYSKFRGTNWGGLGKYHLYYYTHKSLNKLLKDTGFKPIFLKSHKIDVLSFDALWRWGVADYRVYWKLEQVFILSKLMGDTNAPVKKMYEEGLYTQIKDVAKRQIESAQNRQSVVLKLQQLINSPINAILGKMFAGDAIRVFARKK